MQAPTRLRHRLMSVLWSGFLASAVLEMLVFALVDPEALRWFGGDVLDLTPRAVYTLAFFAFWAICSVGAALAVLLCAPPRDDQPGAAADGLEARPR
jgi:phosphotransferase system  glucose/maltose/N-acetylglucosamine-specific IIC component